MKKIVQVFEPENSYTGAQVTYSTTKSRKSFSLRRPAQKVISPPLAVESFAQDPNQYKRLMDAVARLSREQQLQGK
ncbi:MAG: hypothetical protein P8P90_08115 [Opitutales bacterium]|nr:hypothetical protein [Opitutales bacterium]